MPADEQPRDQAGEGSALEELERLHQAIEQSRRKRREANDAFDSFLRSFERRSAGSASTDGAAPNVRVQPRTSEPPALSPSGHSYPRGRPLATRGPASGDLPPSRAAGPATIADERRTPAAEAAVSSAKAVDAAVASAQTVGAQIGPGHASEVEPGVPVEPAAPAATHADNETGLDAQRAEPVVPAALTSAPAPPRTALRWILAATIVLVVAVLAWNVLRPFDAPAPPGQTAVTPEPPRQAPAPPAAAPAPSAPVTELSTERRVWVRVTVDGERVLERELEAGVRIPLKANEQIVIRAGDAGAIRLTIAGKDQGVFGPDGIAVTRTFPVPPASPR